VHPPYGTADVRANTGFDYDEPDNVPVTPPPDAATLSLIRGRILDELAETYPSFAKSMMLAA
jgi:glutaconate CoA-transferase subunit B